MRALLLATTALCLTLAACENSPTFRTEDAGEAPGAWQNAPNVVDAAIQQNWWQNFKDPILDNLIKQATANNLDLKIAASRVREARAELLGIEADQLPSIDAAANVTKNQASTQTKNFARGAARKSTLYNTQLDASWEVNVFSVDAAVEAAKATAGSAQEAERGTLLTLLGEVARNYVNLRQLQNQYALTEQTSKALRTSFELTKAKFDAGLVNALDTARAEALWQTTISQLAPVKAEITAAKNRLCVLLGQNPGALTELDAVKPVPVMQTALVVAAPATVIAERPDIRGSAKDLASATAAQTVASRQYFPKISLSSAFGWSASRTSNLVGGGSGAWSLAAGVIAPIIDFGRIRSDIRISDARAEQAFLTYQRTVLEAQEEVENALSRYFAAVNRQSQLAKAADANQLALELAQERYNKGLVSYIEVTDAQQKLYSAQLEVLNNDTTVSNQLIQLYKALGGGWRTDRPETHQENRLEPIVIR